MGGANSKASREEKVRPHLFSVAKTRAAFPRMICGEKEYDEVIHAMKEAYFARREPISAASFS